ncbi:SLACS reverse transcriptase, putative [Trypanosoma equiperdum]|uniref:SLACS reverse transcriptase, putative n=1 Tax=Trypanosoma equiperdum TaxID=5694 RepID=A0A1G4I7G8_TRYEQ|nr:SLACS reverse transcriptase, putative [Trypanosoma equiperdum]
MAQTIGELYPQEDIHDIPRPPVEQPGVVSVDAEEVAKTIGRRLTRGAAPGLDGWTRELLYPLTLDPALKMEIAAVVKDIINADVSMEVGRRLQATSLTVLRKPNGKYRPIGAESVWAKLASHIAISRVMKTAEKKFSGIQFGVGGHIEEAIAKIRKDFATKGSLAMLDGRNAYNAISRRAILEAVYGDSTWSPLWRLVSLLLGTTGEVGFYKNGKLCHTWESTRGVRQGMVLGPLLFSIGTLATLRRLQQTFPEAQFTAYLDDVTVAAPPEELKNVCAATAEAMEALGIVNNADKTEVLELTGDTGFGTAVKACARVLGAYVAPDPMSEEIREGVEKKAMETDRLFKAIVELPLYNRTRWRILAMSAMPRITFLLRNHDMQHTHQVASWFDERTTQVMEHILGQPMTERARNIAALPVSMGGCGIRRMAQVAEYAHQCAGEKGLQQRKTEEADQRQQDDLYATLGGADRQVFTANTAAGAGRPLTDAQVRLDDATFGVYLRERLLVRVLPEGVKCLCGEDASNHHIHTCTKVHNKPRQMRHDIINSVFANGLRLCGFQCATEPRLNEVSKRRPDILIAGLDTYAVTDITVTYPGRVTVGNTAQGQRSVAAADPMKAALVRFQEKERKYSYWAIQNGLAFAPFVMLTNGAIFGKSRDWLRRVLRGQDHRLTVTTAFDGITADVVAAVLRGNVHVYSAAQARGETLR